MSQTQILDILVPIYVCVLLGFTLGRLVFPWSSSSIGSLVLQVSLPCLIVYKFSDERTVPRDMVLIMIGAAIIIVISLIVFYLFLKFFRLPFRTYLAAMTLSNISVGLALGYLGFGHVGLALSIGFGAIMLIAQFSLGMWLPTGRIQFSSLFREPFSYAVVLGIILLFTQNHLPSYFERTLLLIGEITVPVMLLALGFALSHVRFRGFSRGMILAVVHLAVSAVIGIGVAYLLNLHGEDKALLILMAILPSSTVNVIMGEKAGADMEPLTIFITCTNILMVLSLPLALWILL